AELARLTASDAEGKAALLKRTIARNDRLQELAEQPLLLTLIARLHTEKGGNLPEKRERLYAEAVDMLLTQWENLKVIDRANGDKIILDSLSEWLKASPDDIRAQLDKLAFEAHRDQADMKGTADITQGRLFEALLAATPQKNVNHQRLEEHLRDRAGLLASHGEKLYQFPHRTFQEYLAACHLTNAGFPEELAELARTEPGRWREATLLAAAKVSRGTAKSVWDLVEALCFQDIPQGQSPQTADLWGALLAGQALWETGLAEAQDTAQRHQPKRERVRLWLQAIVENGWLPPVDRAKAGQALSVLGDGRELTALVSIPEGEFWMGDDNNSDASPRHRLKLPAFQIGRYPVTNGQYEPFVQAIGRYWGSSEAGKPERRNHPAIDVTWHDALAYCDWLTGQERALGRIGPNQAYTLPSEAEWERAAAGTAGLRFPWGNDWQDDHANTIESGLGETSSVGLFPKGRSPEACLDMAGNVWEWTRSLWGKDWQKPEFAYPYPEPEYQREVRENLQAGDEMWRVVRGGSWFSDLDLSRCAVRSRNRPGGRFSGGGFRVVVVLCSPPVV
ncbi:MAG: formylglycine-generating enzyme family protein, partial [Candidatus Methylumidiphilus sp.]